MGLANLKYLTSHFCRGGRILKKIWSNAQSSLETNLRYMEIFPSHKNDCWPLQPLYIVPFVSKKITTYCIASKILISFVLKISTFKHWYEPIYIFLSLKEIKLIIWYPSPPYFLNKICNDLWNIHIFLENKHIVNKQFTKLKKK